MLTTVIAAYPKPDYLKLTDWFKTEGGTDTLHPTKLYNSEIHNLGPNNEIIFQKAIKEVIDEQINCGLDIITDGEIRRENYIHYHCRHINGINFDRLTKKVARTGNYECFLPTITKKISSKEEFLTKDWQTSQKFSSKPIKITIPGPLTISDTIANEYYSSIKAMTDDLAKVINIEVKRLSKIGCKYIQIDEPLFARKPKEAINFGIEQLEKCFYGIEDDIQKITHICCGYPDKLDAVNYPKAPLESYFEISKFLDESIIDAVSIEDAHRYNDLKLLENFKKTKIIIGLIKIANSNIETVEEIDSRIKSSLNYINKERLIAAPDCGLGHLPRNLIIKKLTNLVKAAKLN